MTENDNPIKDEASKTDASPKKPSEAANKNTAKSELKKKPAPSNWSKRVLIVFVIFFVGAAAAIYFMPVLKERLPFVANWIGENDPSGLAAVNAEMNNQQLEIDALSQKLTALEFSLGQLSSAGPTTLGADIEERLKLLEERMDAIPTETREIASSSPQDTSQSGRIDMLLSRMSQLEASFIPLSKNMIDAAQAEKERQALQNENASFSDKLSNIESRLESVEKIAAKDNSGILVNLKVGELKRKLLSGQPYQAELGALRNLVSKTSLTENLKITEALDYLSQSSAMGIPTPDQLSRQFDQLLPTLLGAEGIDENASWWQNTLNSIKNMITVRRTDQFSPADEGLDSLIARIERWLSSRDLRPIIDLMETLPAEMQQLLADWRSALERWLQSEDAIYDLETEVAESYLVDAPATPEVPAEAQL